MTFHEQIAADFNQVFLNTLEFGHVRLWNGNELLCADDATLEHEAPAANGVNVDRKRIICRRSSVPNLDEEGNPIVHYFEVHPLPKVTEQVLFEGEYWEVTDVKTPLGQVVITLQRMVS